MFVIKADGTREKFDERKIIRTCIRSGVSRRVAGQIASKIKSQISSGFKTGKIYRMILRELERVSEKSPFFYKLRKSIAKIDPESYELYVKKILEAHGYKCEWNILIRGEYVEHQVDVVARKGKEMYLVECKRHINPHRLTGLGVVLQVHARLEAIQDGFKKGLTKYNFTNAWIFNNTKFSEHAKKYALGNHMLLSGWKYKGNISIESMTQNKKVFPVTILDLGEQKVKKLFSKKIITVNDLISADKNILKRLSIGNDTIEKAEKLLL